MQAKEEFAEARRRFGLLSFYDKQFPNAKIDGDRIFINDGQIWTSAGMTAGIDLALALIENDLGAQVAKSVARKLVVYHRRGGDNLSSPPSSNWHRSQIGFRRRSLMRGKTCMRRLPFLSLPMPPI